MANAQTLKKYLIDKKSGYLVKPENNKKTIMLSGKWGSGKTHFWEKVIIPILDNMFDANEKEDVKDYKRENSIPNHYISLYGKTSIEQIKNEIFTEIFKSSKPLELEKKGIKLIKGAVDTVSNITKAVSLFGIEFDLSKVTDKSFETLEKVTDDVRLKDTINYLNSGAIICFDDFERKSKDIDLNDLFGFISQLTIEFNCKVVIILNDDVFEGEEKKVFSNVKEKTVAKYLYYSPTIKELFDLIYDDNGTGKYKGLDEYRKLILKTIEETEELNARIYIQVLDNLLEWINDKQDDTDNVIRCLILVNMSFILFHLSLKQGIKDNKLIIKDFYDMYDVNEKTRTKSPSSYNNFSEYFGILKKEVLDHQFQGNKTAEELISYLELNIIKYNCLYFINKYSISRNIGFENFNKIMKFIETGILPNE